MTDQLRQFAGPQLPAGPPHRVEERVVGDFAWWHLWKVGAAPAGKLYLPPSRVISRRWPARPRAASGFSAGASASQFARILYSGRAGSTPSPSLPRLAVVLRIWAVFGECEACNLLIIKDLVLSETNVVP